MGRERRTRSRSDQPVLALPLAPSLSDISVVGYGIVVNVAKWWLVEGVKKVESVERWKDKDKG